MREYRCTNPHRSRPGQPCNHMFFEGELIQGELSVRCEGCHKDSVVRGDGPYTAVADAIDVIDKQAVAV